MKKVIIGSVCILSSVIIYATRYITAALLTIDDAIRKGNVGIDGALPWVGNTTLWISIIFFIIGIIFVFFGLKEDE